MAQSLNFYNIMKRIDLNKIAINLEKQLIKSLYELNLLGDQNDTRVYECHFFTPNKIIIKIITLKKNHIFSYDSPLIYKGSKIDYHLLKLPKLTEEVNFASPVYDSPMFSLN